LESEGNVADVAARGDSKATGANTKSKVSLEDQLAELISDENR